METNSVKHNNSEMELGYCGSKKSGTENGTGPDVVEPKTEPEPTVRNQNRTGTVFFEFIGTGTGTVKKIISSR